MADSTSTPKTSLDIFEMLEKLDDAIFTQVERELDTDPGSGLNVTRELTQVNNRLAIWGLAYARRHREDLVTTEEAMNRGFVLMAAALLKLSHEGEFDALSAWLDEQGQTAEQQEIISGEPEAA